MHDGNNNPSCDIGLRGLDLLDDIIERIHTNLRAWDQGNWACAPVEPRPIDADEQVALHWQVPETCGTAYCVAGWAAHLTGAKIDWYPLFYESYNVQADVTQITFHGWSAVCVNDGEDEISDYAMKVLGLAREEADRLFRAENTLTELEALRDRLRAGKRIACWWPNQEPTDSDRLA